ncbi:MAG: hypothetical protein ACI87E_004819 [Mariniblastus sp.]|jgi:hypothetical protein
MIRYGLTIFLSAFLLFQVQPMIARFILPWFGGTAAVWTTCMMFFQIVLLLGYLYSHLLRRMCSPKQAWLIHLCLLVTASLLTSASPSESLQPDGSENLTWAIVGVLAFSIGLPYFALSSTGPLIQAWQSSSHARLSPYRLYALSNLGSMLALVSYPFLIEPTFPLAVQAKYWTIGFFLFALASCWSGWQTVRRNSWAEPKSETNSDSTSQTFIAGPTLANRLLWFILAAAASIVLLATTNLLCQEVASIPFLWILPLGLYLLSFIICFDRPALYRRRVFVPLLVGGTIAAISLVHLNVYAGLLLQVVGLAGVCFAASMLCHGELERMKPLPSYLTEFYLWISFGGAAGGVFVCIIAPAIFTSFLEFHVGLLICLAVAIGAIYAPKSSAIKNREQSEPAPGVNPPRGMGGIVTTGLVMVVIVAGSLVVSSMVYFLDPSYQQGLVFRGRNEYGLASVVEMDGYRKFINGRVEHGGQRMEPGHEMEHISYYVPGSGVGVAFAGYRATAALDSNLDVAVIGLGAGAMATWLEAGDSAVFYEINPMVADIASEHFTFLKNSAGDCRVKLGDGRMQLLNESRHADSPRYDLLFMDAFSSDSIPIHLLTSECIELYLRRLKPEGVLIAHITNRFIDLLPVIQQHAQDHGLEPILIEYQSDDKKIETRWVLLTKNQAFLQSTAVIKHRIPWPETLSSVKWTDDFSSVAPLLDWSAGVDWRKMQQQLKMDRATKETTVENRDE